LDWVVRLMQKYPSLVLELSAHTDARGTNNYNKWLSRKRAKSAVKYITDRGISSFRLQANGYDRKDVQVYYLDNDPEKIDVAPINRQRE